MSTKPITEFDGPYRFLSNFWPFPVVLEGVEYPSIEHAFQAAKTLDVARRLQIKAAKYSGAAKKMGRSSMTIIRPDWDDVKIEIMLDLLRQKLNNNRVYGTYLVRTKDAELIEGNWWKDVFWGVCDGEGLNVLGILLMLIREELKEK